jgi:putative membrane protein
MLFDTMPEWLPPLNSGLIVVSGIFLLMGYFFIKRGQIAWHKRFMLTACVFAAGFLVVYVSRVALFPNKLFPGEGLLRTIYFTILVPHVIIAALVAPFAFVTVRRALAGNFVLHRKIAPITFAMWLFTAISGWVVYWMLYHAE